MTPDGAPVADRYGARQRERNVELLKGLMQADSEAAFDIGLRELCADFHPGVVAEIDYAERIASDDHAEAFRHHADGVFQSTLPLNLALRRADFDVSDDRLQALVDAGRAFFERHWTSSEPDLRDALGAPLAARVDEALARGDGSAPSSAAPVAPPVDGDVDRARLPGTLDVWLFNLLLQALDDPLSHECAQTFLRGWRAKTGAIWPSLPGAALDSRARLDELADWLAEAAADARRAGLGSWSQAAASVRRTVLDRFESLDGDRYEGEHMTGSGTCSRCSMHFASESTLAFGTACADVRRTQHEGASREDPGIFLSRDISAAWCPFCGHAERINSPSLFHHGDRRQIVYCVPRAPDEPLDAAMARWGEVIVDGRARYASRLAPGELAAFDACTEIVTSSVAEFFYAIWRGDTVPEDHAWNVVTLAGNARMLVDRTKNVLWELLPGEGPA